MRYRPILIAEEQINPNKPGLEKIFHGAVELPKNQTGGTPLLEIYIPTKKSACLI